MKKPPEPDAPRVTRLVFEWTDDELQALAPMTPLEDIRRVAGGWVLGPVREDKKEELSDLLLEELSFGGFYTGSEREFRSLLHRAHPVHEERREWLVGQLEAAGIPCDLTGEGPYEDIENDFVASVRDGSIRWEDPDL